MNKQKLNVSKTRLLVNFVIVFFSVFVSQIPGCAIVCADDAGQIDYEKNETLIDLSKYLFAFPLRLFVSTSDGGLGQLLAVYFGNILLLSLFVFLIVLLLKALKKGRLQKPAKQTFNQAKAN